MGAISEKAIQRFLYRDLDNFDWVKGLTPSQIGAALSELGFIEDIVGKLWLHQKASLLVMQHHPRFIFHIGMGGGKGLPLNANVLTPWGWKKINELEIGSVVCATDGTRTEIIGIYPQGVQPCYKLKWSDGLETICDFHHIWLAWSAKDRMIGTKNTCGEKSAKKWTTKQIFEYYQAGRPKGRLGIPVISKPNCFVNKGQGMVLKKTVLPPYVLGVILGDGSISNKSVSFTSGDPEIVNRIEKLLSVKLTTRSNSENSWDYRIPNYIFKKELEKLGLMGKKSEHKFIPLTYMQGTVEQRWELLRGLMDTDGWVDKDGDTYFCSTSRKLIENVRELAWSLGAVVNSITLGSGTYTHKNEIRPCLQSYTIRIKMNEPYRMFHLSRKKKRCADKKPQSMAYWLESIEKVEDQETICIQVSHPNSLFITDNYRVTHNTLLMLTLLRHRKLRGERVRAICFVPYISAVATWVDEIAKFAPELICVPLIGSSKENAERLIDNKAAEGVGDIFVICYASAICITADRCFLSFDTLICDEIHKLKNHRTKIFQLAKFISQQATYVYGLSGTPFGKDIGDLWAEFYVIDFGETLGPNITYFRNVFFEYKQNFYGRGEYKPIKSRVKQLKRMIKNKSLHYSVKELDDIPEKQYIPIHIPLPGGIKSRVEQAHKELKQAVINRDTKLAGNSFLTLRQLSSGFVTFKDTNTDEDEKPQRFKIRFDENPKLDTLIGLIEAMPPECRMVVFHDYIETGQIISEKLTTLGIRHSRIYGGTNDKLKQLSNFTSNSNYNVLLLNSRSGSSALNLQIANYIVFYECPSVIDREQAEARCYRPGQTKKVFIYDLFVAGTIDEQHYNTVKAGGDLLKDFLSGKAVI